MDKLPAKILNQLIQKYGIKLIKEPKRCEALLRDTCENKYRREIFVLIKAIKEGIPTELLNTPDSSRDEALFIRLVRRLCENIGLNKIAAIWAVSTWVSVLKIELIITKATPKPKAPPKPPSLPKPPPKPRSLPKPPPPTKVKKFKFTKMIGLGIFSIAIIGVIIIIKEQDYLELHKIQQQIIEEKAQLLAIRKEINSTKAEREKVLTQYNKDKQFKRYCENTRLRQPEMVKLPQGRFLMGNIQSNGNSDEQPVHLVDIASFSIGRYEITFKEYDSYAKAVGKKLPDDSNWERANHPVINVSWHDAIAYANCLSLQTGQKYRLPTEAEWEYAARAGMNTQYSWGNKKSYNKANCSECSSSATNKTMPVTSFKPNAFGLYNMQGNVSEWTCSEADNKYKGKEQQCIKKPNNKQFIIVRSGSWKSPAKEIRTSTRAKALPNERNNTLGFRLVRTR